VKYTPNTDINEIFSKSRSELGDLGTHGFPHKLHFVAKFHTFSKCRVFFTRSAVKVNNESRKLKLFAEKNKVKKIDEQENYHFYF